MIADDGSTTTRDECIDRLRGETKLAIRHVWHEDRGFRKCTILNRAIVESTADYLVFSDGDCIPRWDFLATHVRHARPGYFLSGGYFKLPLDLSQAITGDDILYAPHDRRPVAAFARLAVGTGSRSSFPPARGWRAARSDHDDRRTWNGHNSSGWKADIVRVNGFDERMEWGGEDREMGERLMNHGIRGKRIRFRAVCVHLDHAAVMSLRRVC